MKILKILTALLHLFEVIEKNNPELLQKTVTKIKEEIGQTYEPDEIDPKYLRGGHEIIPAVKEIWLAKNESQEEVIIRKVDGDKDIIEYKRKKYRGFIRTKIGSFLEHYQQKRTSKS